MRSRTTSTTIRIPLFRPDTGDAEADAVREVLVSGWLTTGPKCHELEARTAIISGTALARTVSSCSMGLFLGLRAVDVGPGDVVITTPMTFAASAQAILWAGARPVLADVDADSLLLDPQRVAEVTDTLSRTGIHSKAVVAVHYGGQPAPVEALHQAAGHVPIIEDAAHAWGTTVTVRNCVARAYSLYANKTITCGEGGVVATDSPAVAEFILHGRDHGSDLPAFGRARDPVIMLEGYKGNLSDVQAAIALVQLQRLEAKRAKRQAIVRWYGDRLRNGPVQLLGLIESEQTCPYLYVVRVRAGLRDRVREALRSSGIATGLHYMPVHRHAWLASRVWAPRPLPVAERAGDRMLTLPLHEFLTEEDVDEICRRLLRAVGA